MTTGERIKARRKELGISAESLAEALNVSAATVYRYEKGDIEKVPGSILEPLSKLLRTTPAYLMGWEENPEQPTLVNDDPELTEYLEELKNRDEMRMLFKLAKNATKADVMRAVAIIEALRKEDED